ncbi:UPF0193 protein EVG1 [Alosa pseudoharengus]|uniref:UPF0193 protein EVG1 n=1 Tax=Alosa pseudoharengus TaxID=34774 RepID=UPI003F8C8908
MYQIMEHPRNGHGGLWNCPRTTTRYSKETQEMLKLMMQESRLTNLQQRKLSSHLRKGEALPLTCNPTSSAPPPQPKPMAIKTSTSLSAKPLRRQAEVCKAGDSYKRELFRPSATRDLEKEKRRLQNILSGSEGDPKPRGVRSLAKGKSVDEEEKDRFQEVLEEIEDRKQFLEEMTSLGMGSHYQHIINTEISQKIRELELIDKARSASLQSLLKEEKRVENTSNDNPSL